MLYSVTKYTAKASRVKTDQSIVVVRRNTKRKNRKLINKLQLKLASYCREGFGKKKFAISSVKKCVL